ncbi:MAG: WGR domain-containing protein [Microcoleus sp. PH2017_10_PVI_O_A]|uniref:WGR domain-containing protein n=1 Tax=unclassified Microcoleus TaxID=2642155 RepID=UPI001DBD2E5F|nr:MULTISPECIES: WGR domain-containing protein [unclassified Microcoleus]TAE82312.1 MAG: WGR domain-containing protein [Oscillatoriales cyanobacterium]MCC3406842.1 WGR domain-containing protein [Microcoleus sp. PH2017_10_PVI_O_A]MCC3460978.1 WGR domain-containing protein [Microcoleus sp. PH2017_11_PCY_U_A]MCC3479499.1 WGR domain-containing protein [Microcoleus sp. PH2017_12_PCY_D_A]MCC3526794.1 WGR domain-containing protein [Microcoleus sp. PH2017_21_RUC_O_A]
MKLIKRTALYFQDGRSDKVYEVDLCQAGENLYSVNFRYGRRGANLKEGTKTDTPVPLAQAEKVFDKLVAEKVKKGYQEAASADVAPAPELPRAQTRQQAILNRIAGGGNPKWPLERAIWRAGELKIAEAGPGLIALIGTGEPLRDYCIAWSLGWCGGGGAVEALTRLYRNPATAEFVRRIAFEGLLKLADEDGRSHLQAEIIELLPSHLRELVANDNTEAFSAALKIYLDSEDSSRFAVLDRLYQIDSRCARSVLLDILKTAPLKPNYFKQIRHIFKMAEYRRDAEVFAILARRFEDEKAMYRRNYLGVRIPGDDYAYLSNSEWKYNKKTNEYKEVKTNKLLNEMQSPNARIAYSSNTREYLLRRVWRTLKQLGESGDADYVKMAVSILLQYVDSDAKAVLQSTYYQWNRSNWTRFESGTAAWDVFAGYLTFNRILYENSPRYVYKHNSAAWRCKEGYKPGDAEPSAREEAFPELWEQHPDALLQLLLESNCRPVHHFAVKALKACPQFLAGIDADTAIKLIAAPYEVTAELGFNLAVENGYHRYLAHREVIVALVNCIFLPARTQAFDWIDEQRDRILSDTELIVGLVTSLYADTRQFARRFLNSSILESATVRVLIGKLIAHLLTFQPTEFIPTHTSIVAKDIADTLLLNFTPQLRNIGLGVVLDLLRHPLPEVQELGARILVNHEIAAADLPPELIESLIASPYEQIRGIGIRLFGQLPDESLTNSPRTLIVGIALNTLPDIRNSIKPVIRRLAAEYPEFAALVAGELIDVLVMPERQEGVHGYLLNLLREDIPGWMAAMDKDKTWLLLKAKSAVAQELGGLVMVENCANWAADFDTIEIVKLASHEILSVREAARQMFLQKLDAIRTNSQEMLSAVRLLEAKWDDSREFAARIFRTELTDEDWTPEIMVSLCDSIREDVRQFGRDLVIRYFQDESGQDYLLKFSEHPSADMQLFATNYLEGYAASNPERLRELAPFFVAVLSRVNQGRVAKKRVFAFLDAEAQKSEAAARIVADILTRQSATIALGDKAAAIETMLKIRRSYPQIDLPIQVKPVVEVRT